MPLFTLGINHRTAPVTTRERVTFAPAQLSDALRQLTALGTVHEAAVLSTCNRTELYCLLEGDTTEEVIDWLCRYHGLSRQDVDPYIYSYPNANAVEHMLRVASGLDSMILGEPQILGQMKEAFAKANDAGTIGTLLGRLFQHTFSVAKQIRTDTAIGSSPVSVAFAAVSLAKQIFGDLDQQTVLLLGAGETIELAARHLHESNIGRIIVANRTAERARKLASQFNGYAITLDEIPAHLTEADIVIASTASPQPLLSKAQVKAALKARKHRPMFLVDIAVPRDIEAAVGELDDAYLYTVDDLQEVIQENLKSRQAAAEQAEEIVESQAQRFMEWLRSRDAVSLIRDYRHQAEISRDEVLDKARQQLQAGRDPAEVVQQLAHTLTNKLIHEPCVQITRAGAEGHSERLESARQLLGLEQDKK